MNPIPATGVEPTSAPQPVDVVVHTHWDREWYMDRETTLSRLEMVMRRVIDDLDTNRLDQFLFDGQTVALEDLLSRADPSLAQRLRAHAREGRLILGPWYVASDEFLVCGESLVRNLALGISQAQAWGETQRVGYLPDTFGHVAQMPQILRQFGIAHAVVWRGADAPTDLFDWQAPDGTTVSAVFLSEGYYLHPLHGDDWLAQTHALLHKLAARRDPNLGGPLLLTHGGDHLAPHPLLKKRLRAFNEGQSSFVLRLGTLESHVSQLVERSVGRGVERPLIRGELRRNQSAFVLPDVLSTRRHLKRLHQAAEDRLIGEIEPLMAQLGSDPSTQSALDRAWQVLLQQQAHDSICGCSIDEVHRQMELRLRELDRALDALKARVLHGAGMTVPDCHGTRRGGAAQSEKPTGSFMTAAADVFADDTQWTLFNPLPRHREGWWVVELFLKGARRDRLSAIDAEGVRVPMAILQAQEDHELISPLDEFPQRLDGYRYLVALHGHIGGLETIRMTVLAGDDSSDSSDSASSQDSDIHGPVAIDNGAWRVELDTEGRLLVTDQRQGTPRPRQVSLLSELDAGDTYNHSPVAGMKSSSNPRWVCRSLRRSGPVQELQLDVELPCPQGLKGSRTAGTEALVTCSGHLTLRLLGVEPLLRAELCWTNTARDQRTRLVFDGVPADTPQTWRDTAFAWTAHGLSLAQIPESIGRSETPVSVQPSLSALVAGPWMMVHRAMHEHEIIRDANRDPLGDLLLGVTLVRSVGWMSRRDLRTRGVGAGPDLPTPEAQCLGKDHFEFALVAHSSDTPSHRALHHAEVLRRPMMALRGHGTTWKRGVDLGDLPLQVSCCRRQPGGPLEIRVWNPTDQPLKLGAGRDGWEAVRADGQALPPDDEGMQRVVRPHGLLTLRSTQSESRR